MVGRDGQEKLIQRTFAGEVGSHQKNMVSKGKARQESKSQGVKGILSAQGVADCSRQESDIIWILY